jgi:Uma2 family endonuclease
MSQVEQARATLADLERVTEKAELIDGRIIHLTPTGYRPNRVAFRIARSIDEHVEATHRGVVLSDNAGFYVGRLPSGRESFSPDAAFYDGPLPVNEMRFLPGPPTLAVEVRGEGDYGPAAAEAMAAKRADYFAAGTRVVWDVDPLDGCIHVYHEPSSAPAVTYQRGQEAEAEPAVPGWQVSVDWLFS